MAKFRCYAQYTVELEYEFEAADRDEAEEIVDEADGSEFTVVGMGDWIIYDVVEVGDEEEDEDEDDA